MFFIPVSAIILISALSLSTGVAIEENSTRYDIDVAMEDSSFKKNS